MFLYFERTWWTLLQKRVMRNKFDIYVFITIAYMALWVVFSDGKRVTCRTENKLFKK